MSTNVPPPIQSTPTTACAPRPVISNAAVWACAALLGINLLIGAVGSPAVTYAGAQPEKGKPVLEPPFNASGDRKMLQDAIASLAEKVSRIETKLDKGINVKVTEMPAINVKKD